MVIYVFLSSQQLSLAQHYAYVGEFDVGHIAYSCVTLQTFSTKISWNYVGECLLPRLE